MKKFITICISSLLLMVNSNAEVSMGISGTALYYDASGDETVKSSGTKNSKSESGVAPMASLFIEKELDYLNNSLTVSGVKTLILGGSKISDKIQLIKNEIEERKIFNLKSLYDNYQSMKRFYIEHTTKFSDKKLYYKHNEDFINIGSLNNINTDILKNYYIIINKYIINNK